MNRNILFLEELVVAFLRDFMLLLNLVQVSDVEVDCKHNAIQLVSHTSMEAIHVISLYPKRPPLIIDRKSVLFHIL